MNQNRDVDTRTAQLLVCSAATGRGASNGNNTNGNWSRLFSFMIVCAVLESMFLVGYWEGRERYGAVFVMSLGDVRP